jgi:hypothetical protein
MLAPDFVFESESSLGFRFNPAQSPKPNAS